MQKTIKMEKKNTHKEGSIITTQSTSESEKLHAYFIGAEPSPVSLFMAQTADENVCFPGIQTPWRS